MTRPLDRPSLPTLPPLQQLAVAEAWRIASAEQPSFKLLPPPNRIFVLIALGVQAAAASGITEHEDLVAAGLAALPKKPKR